MDSFNNAYVGTGEARMKVWKIELLIHGGGHIICSRRDPGPESEWTAVAVKNAFVAWMNHPNATDDNGWLDLTQWQQVKGLSSTVVRSQICGINVFECLAQQRVTAAEPLPQRIPADTGNVRKLPTQRIDNDIEQYLPGVEKVTS